MSIARTLRALVSDLDSDMARVRAKTLGTKLAKPRPNEVRVFTASTSDDETANVDAARVVAVNPRRPGA